MLQDCFNRDLIKNQLFSFGSSIRLGTYSFSSSNALFVSDFLSNVKLLE